MESIRHRRNQHGIKNNSNQSDQAVSTPAEMVRADQGTAGNLNDHPQWCTENGINPATYYYHLRRLLEQCLEKIPAIVPLITPLHSSDIHIEKNRLKKISLLVDVNPETLLALVRELC